MIIRDMGEALQHWLGFHSKIGKEFMMDESAFKYPIADYLTNAGQVNLKALVLERSHPRFTSKIVDIRIDAYPKNSPVNFFELKLAKAETPRLSERKRIFNDIARLQFARAHTTGDCFFIIAGKTAYFQQCFKNTTCSPTDSRAFYQHWFEFRLNRPKTFVVAAETDSNYLPIYNSFSANYGVALPTNITTKCEYLTSFNGRGNSPYMTGIWSVT